MSVVTAISQYDCAKSVIEENIRNDTEITTISSHERHGKRKYCTLIVWLIKNKIAN